MFINETCQTTLYTYIIGVTKTIYIYISFVTCLVANLTYHMHVSILFNIGHKYS